MVDSRQKLNPETIYLCFLDISPPKEKSAPEIRKTYPGIFPDQDEILKRAPEFCYPCAITSDGVQYSTFVLTDIDSKFRYGFCRYLPHATHCLCIISYLPWFEAFYYMLDRISEFKDETTIQKFLELLFNQAIPKAGSKLKFKFTSTKKEMNLSFDIPDPNLLPKIPANRNLTEYFAKVDPGNMVNLFISMLFERRIIISSEKLSVLTAVIHGSVSLLYPMQWQHIFVPILPPSLLLYCCAPMPFLVGIHASMMEEVRSMPLDDVVIFDADSKEMEIYGEDFRNFPSQVASRLKRKLLRTDYAFQNDYVAKLFLKALADLIGGYRDALKFTEDSLVTFDEDLFLDTRSGELKDFLTDILALQSFQQFIRGRLDLLNEGTGFADIFEQAVTERNKDVASEAKYKQMMDKMRYEVKKSSGVLKKTVEDKYTDFKGIEVKELKNRFKKKVKDGYKVTKTMVSHSKQPTLPPEPENKETTIKRNHSLPASSKDSIIASIQKDRRSMYSSFPRRDLPKPTRTPPPRPPPPASSFLSTNEVEVARSSELPRKKIVNKGKRFVDLDFDPSDSSQSECSSIQSLPILSSVDQNNDSNDDRLLNIGSNEEVIGSFSNPIFHDPRYERFATSDESDIFEIKPVNSHVNDAAAQNNNTFDTYSKEKVSGHPENSDLVEIFSRNKEPDENYGPTTSFFMGNNALEKNVHEKGSFLLPGPPFYVPTSNDLIGLDSTLFHETMSALSDDTRNLMSKDSSPSNSFLFDIDNKVNDSNIFTSSNENVMNVEPKVLHVDPFSTFYEEAKKKLSENS